MIHDFDGTQQSPKLHTVNEYLYIWSDLAPYTFVLAFSFPTP